MMKYLSTSISSPHEQAQRNGTGGRWTDEKRWGRRGENEKVKV